MTRDGAASNRGAGSAAGHGRFVGRTCLVTGSTGMAASAARAIAAEGGRVFIVSRTADHAAALAAEIGDAGGTAAWQAGDVSREPDVEAAVGACADQFGRLDAVYSAAGVSGRRYGDGPLHEATLEGWETVLATNARSQFLVCRAAVRRMLDQEPDSGGQRGVILTMSSTLASHPAPVHFATHAYAASKGAIEALTRAAAAYYGPHGIRINALAPGLIATPMSLRAQEDPAILGYLRGKQPLAGGPIGADDVTRVALFLLSGEARMVTGQVVAVDGGWTVREA
jgi:NAD(P)-dependent dehydrogenase (short-subunit alcohol dehydrogenase family)